jgi:hypothetical protein
VVEIKEEELKRLQAENALEISSAYKALFNTKAGKIVLEDLAQKFYLVTPTHTAGDDSLTVMKREGMRAAVCYILSAIELETSDMLKVIKNANKAIEDRRKKVEFIGFDDEEDYTTLQGDT